MRQILKGKRNKDERGNGKAPKKGGTITDAVAGKRHASQRMVGILTAARNWDIETLGRNGEVLNLGGQCIL